MIAGTAVLIQSLLKQQGRAVLSPKEMRSLLVSTGSPQTSNNSKYIGKFPNIVAAADKLGIALSDDILMLIIPLLGGNQADE